VVVVISEPEALADLFNMKKTKTWKMQKLKTKMEIG
jgi:hypothetical protein